MAFHGIRTHELTDVTRPTELIPTSTIGLVGTAPNADAAKFPLNVPVRINGSRVEAAELGTDGTLPWSIDGIFDQGSATVVVVRVEEGADFDASKANVIGGVDANGRRQGIQALYDSAALGILPRVLIAPGFTHDHAVATELVSAATRLKAVVIADGPNSTSADAVAYAGNFGSNRLFLVDPAAEVFDTVSQSNIFQPVSARVAGLIARVDHQRGWWWSPSNHEIFGIVGTGRPVSYLDGDLNTEAQYLNDNKIATIIRDSGWRLWGNVSTASDPAWQFLCVRRTFDQVLLSTARALKWANDNPITGGSIDEISDQIAAFLARLRALGAIINGKVWLDPALNTPSVIANGELYVDYDLTPPYPLQTLHLRGHLTTDYIEELFQ